MSKSKSKRSLQAKLDSVSATAKDAIEEEYGVELTPASKETRFLCGQCAWSLTAMAKADEKKLKARHTLEEQASTSSYIATKLHSARYTCKKGRSPMVTPRKSKSLRLFSPVKVSMYVLKMN